MLEYGGARIEDLKEGGVFGRETTERASVLKESEKGLIVDFGRVVREKTGSSSIR